ncbi:DNA repair protein RecO [bacterium HR17]|uniref:DNA repair protein RecO n=1 Tax=Candidatus Fervidibacter japonicus TaxID=2035412 RepID=A0A2H5X919_9BACT|nr:DNA repair protein RecO [bacterium HR17]
MLLIPRVTVTTALVLRAEAWREKDRLLVLLTRERGKVTALAQGAQRPQNRLVAAAQTGVQAVFWLARGRERDRVTDVLITHLPQRLRSDGMALTAFGVLAEVLKLATPAEAPDAALFDEVVALYARLEAGAPVHKWLVTVLIRLLWRFGWMPYLLDCAICRQPIGGSETVFAPSAGGALCGGCAVHCRLPDRQTVTVATLRALDALWREPRLMDTLHLRPVLWEQAIGLLRSVWCYHLESDLRAWRVWHQWSGRRTPSVLLPRP